MMAPLNATSVICLGAATVDTVLHVPRLGRLGEKVLAGDCLQFGAGMASSAAASIARLRGTVQIWSRVGDDAAGQQYIASLTAEGVDTSAVRVIAGAKTGIGVTLVDPSGERLVVPYYDLALDPSAAWLPLQAVDDAAAVLADCRWCEGGLALLAAARARHIPAVLDADIAPVDDLRRLAGAASHPIFSRRGLTLFVGEQGAPETLLQAASARLPTAIAVGVTLDAAGCLLAADGDIWAVPGFQVSVVDTLSAGDVFHGAFTLALAEGQTLTEAATFANAAAALKCTVFGGRLGAPDRANVDALLSTKS
jgi:sulfofructose kinase